MRNNNQAIVRKITGRTLSADKKRNLFILAAIALTMFLLGSVFSVGMSLLESVKINQIRFAGTVAQAAIGHPTASQLERLHSLDYVKTVGTGNNVGFVKTGPEMGRISLTLHYFDHTEWEELRTPAYADIEGSYPQQENEIMVSRWLLKKWGISNPTIGMEIPLTYYTDSENSDVLSTQNFYLSGWFTSYGAVQSLNTADVILVSQELSQKHGKTVENDGSATVIFDNPALVREYCERLVPDLELSENQPVVQAETANIDEGQMANSAIALCAIVIFLIFTGYLLIYNVLYISVSRDVRFYGLLKTLGTTPKQIKKIVTGQILRLCMVGIPIGLIFSLLLSFVFVPFFISQLGAVSTEAVVSFSPIIYLGAVAFTILTAVLGAMKPAQKAAGISPIEAQKYTGAEVNANKIHLSGYGKPSKMALRNIFRDRKRAGVVLLSLFLGVTILLSVTTLIFSMNIEGYIESAFESDFVLKNEAQPTQKFDEVFIKKLEALPGFEWLSVTTWEKMSLDYSPDAFGEYIANFPMQEQITGLTEQDIYENFRGFVLGVDGEMLIRSSDTLDNLIDIDAFERGEFALIATDNPGLFSNVNELTISPSDQSETNNAGNSKIHLPLGGFVPFGYKGIGSGFAPTVLISNALMQEWFSDPIISTINFDVSSDYEQSTLIALKQITDNDDEISLMSKREALDELYGAKMVLLVLGGGITLVIALIGILNFVNVMSVSIMVRKRELATLESIGMGSKQMRAMLRYEGGGYAVITILGSLTFGNLITYGLFLIVENAIDIMQFTYPFIPVLLLYAIIALVCYITPEIAYQGIRKMTLVERLREAE